MLPRDLWTAGGRGGGERDDLPRKIRVDEFHNELTGYSNPVQPLLL